MEFKVVEATKWNQLPIPTPPKPKDEYEPIIALLEQGDIVEITVADVKEFRGKRISIGRKASARNFSVEFRTEGNSLFVKKSGDAPVKIEKMLKKIIK